MKKRAAGLSVGGSSILMIFVLLCLTTFATLSVVSARADLRLSQKARQSAEAYYTADALAEEKLALVGEVLSQLPSGGDYLSGAMEALRDGVEGLEFTLGEDSFTVLYAVPMGESAELRVAILVEPPTAGKKPWSRQEWAVHNTGAWDVEEEGLNLWDGGFFGEAPAFGLAGIGD